MYNLQALRKLIDSFSLDLVDNVVVECAALRYMDSGVALFLERFFAQLRSRNISYTLQNADENTFSTLQLARSKMAQKNKRVEKKQQNFLERIGKKVHAYYYNGLLCFFYFLGSVFSVFFKQFFLFQNIRIKELLFEINESAIKAIGIITLTSFLVGLVVAYQSAYQLKMYGANIFIVDMMGLSILRELAPMITAIVIAGRSGSSYTAQIGAMKITQEIDAMRTMGFDPYAFLVLPRMAALILTMPLLIFIADIAGMLGGILVANLDLNISLELFMDRFSEVIAAKHFFVGIIKGPFFAFLIATIAIHRGLRVKDDTQSIGFNTTKSVVESIFAVIVCDAVFSIAFTNLGI